MNDSRQNQLMKAAEVVVCLINAQVDPSVALRKVAADNNMNSKEVDLVSAAVNNSQVISHLETSKPEDKHAPFVITNADEVVDKEHPDDKDTIGQEQEEDKDAGRDATEIKDVITKEALSRSFIDNTDYRKVKSDIATLRAEWDVRDTKLAAWQDPTPMNKLRKYKHIVNEAKLAYTVNRDSALDKIASLASKFTFVVKPDFALMEKAALAEGVTPEILDIVYEAGNLSKHKIARNQTKTAGETIYVTKPVMDLVKNLKEIDKLWKMASDSWIAYEKAIEVHNEREENLLPITKVAADKEKDHGSLFGNSLDLGHVASQAGEHMGAFPEEYTGLNNSGSDTIGNLGHIMNVTKGEGEPSNTLEYNVQQPIKNMGTRKTIESLMADKYIGGHSLPEVVEAYNRAMSVNPKFGLAELQSYLRQDLASAGAVPLDLQIRASKSHHGGGEG